jgi:hypothetical protein
LFNPVFKTQIKTPSIRKSNAAAMTAAIMPPALTANPISTVAPTNTNSKISAMTQSFE